MFVQACKGATLSSSLTLRLPMIAHVCLASSCCFHPSLVHELFLVVDLLVELVVISNESALLVGDYKRINIFSMHKRIRLQSGSWKPGSVCLSLWLRRSHFLSRFLRSSSSCLTAYCFFYCAFILRASSNAKGSISLRMVFNAISDSCRILR